MSDMTNIPADDERLQAIARWLLKNDETLWDMAMEAAQNTPENEFPADHECFKETAP